MNTMKKTKPLTHKEFSSRGGKSFKTKYGIETYSKMGKNGHASKLEKYGPEYYIKLALSGIKGRFSKGLITEESYNRAVDKINSRINTLE